MREDLEVRGNAPSIQLATSSVSHEDTCLYTYSSSAILTRTPSDRSSEPAERVNGTLAYLTIGEGSS